MSSTVQGSDRPRAARLRIGAFRVDLTRNEVSRDGTAVRLEPKVVEVLVHLAAHKGEVVSREELLSALWPGVVVGDDALTQAIIKLRRALGDDAHKPTYIETISKRGYRLIAPVEPAPSSEVEAARVSTSGGWTRRRVAAICALALVVAAGLALLAKGVLAPWPIASDTRGASVRALPVVAVLPLANLSADPGRDYFSDGVTEDVINALGRFSGVRVISYNAVQEFKGQAVPARVASSALGANYIVQGSVRQADGQVRVSVSLNEAGQGVQLWSEKYDGTGGQIFEIQDRMVKSIVGKLAVKVSQAEEQRVFTKPTNSMEAHELVLRARALLKRDERAGNREARLLLARARELAPDYGETFNSLCEADLQRAMYGWMENVRSGMQQAEQWCRQALDSPDERVHTQAHVLLASIYSNQLRFEDSMRHAKRAVELNPSDTRALHREAAALLYGGRVNESIPVFETARRYDPRATSGEGYNLAVAYFMADRPGDALAQADAILSRSPDHAVSHAIRAASLATLGRREEAAEAALQVRRFSPYFQAQHFGARFVDPRLNEKLREGARKAGL